MAEVVGRSARAVVLSNEGLPLGCLPPVDLPTRWWMDTTDLLAALRERFHLGAVVLRLLTASNSQMEPGTEVSYAVEVIGDPPAGLPLEPCEAVLAADSASPLRMPWARTGGVAADVAWADEQLAVLVRPRTAPASQLRSWNLSLLLTLPTGRGKVWLKHVPPFFRHEPSVLALVREAGATVPAVLASDPTEGRFLLEDVAGEDAYSANEELMLRMVESLVVLQHRMASDPKPLLATGVSDCRRLALLSHISGMLARDDVRAELTPSERSNLDHVVEVLPAQFDALYGCGLPDTLVHGDFHPGNHRFDGQRLTLLDWGDSGIGHPLLDMPAFLERVPHRSLERIRAAWIKAWQRVYPEANVEAAADLIGLVAALRLAYVYRQFLDCIEESERVYHQNDPAIWLRRAMALAR